MAKQQTKNAHPLHLFRQHPTLKNCRRLLRRKVPTPHFRLRYAKICHQEGTNYIEEDALTQADIIYVMESKHRKKVLEVARGKCASKIKVLHIPDRFKYYQKELIEILLEKVPLE